MKYVGKNIGIPGLNSLDSNYIVSVGRIDIGMLRSILIKIVIPNKKHCSLWFDPTINYWCSNDSISRDLSDLIDKIKENEEVE